MTVGQLLATTSAQELTDWAAYEQLTGPLDLRNRGDLQAAIIASTVANAMRSKGRAFKPKDFLPDWAPKQREPQSWQTQLALVEGINRAFGGKDLRTTTQ